MNQQVLSKWEKRQASFARVRALIMKIVVAEPGLTYDAVSKRFLLSYGFLPRVGNRIRELRVLGWVTTRLGADELLHVYPRKEAQP